MIGIIIQARTRSYRFPYKIYEDICGQTTLQRVLRGVHESKRAPKIVLAMPEYDKEEFCKKHTNGEFDNCIDNRFDTFFGSADDLMDRYYNAAIKHNIDIIVRICGDSPLIMGSLIDEMIEYYVDNNIEGFLGNIKICDKNYPAGMAIEVFPLWMLEDALSKTNDGFHREHVTTYMYRKGTEYPIYAYNNETPHTVISNRFDNFSFDTKKDLELIERIVKGYDKHFNINKAIEEA